MDLWIFDIQFKCVYFYTYTLKVIFPLNLFTIVVRKQSVSESANLMSNQQEWNVET